MVVDPARGGGNSPSGGQRRERHGLELLVLGGGEAVLHRLLQLVLALVRAPRGDVAVQHEARRHPVGLAHRH